jgi:hypothetical protein
MTAHKSRISPVVFSVLLGIPLLAYGGSRLSIHPLTPRAGTHEVRDEPDPDEAQSCFALGRLGINFRTEKKGPPEVGVILTDPRGRQIGFDPIQKSGFQQLPEAQGYIDCDAPGSEGSCRGVIQVCGPVSGTYKLEIIAIRNTQYSVSVSGRSQEVRGKNHEVQASDSDAELQDVPIQKGSRDLLLLNYSRDLRSKVAFQRQANVPVAAGDYRTTPAHGNTGEAPAPPSLHNNID